MELNPIAYVVCKPNVSLDYIHQSYRQRFGIESSYRIKNICRIKTSNKKPIIRLLFIGISFILVNIWINLLWKSISLTIYEIKFQNIKSGILIVEVKLIEEIV